MVAAVAFLTACNTSQKRQIGLVRDPPDEFDVVSKAPLAMPPDFNLRRPQPGAPSISELQFETQPRATVFGTADLNSDTVSASTQYTASGQSRGERSLLGQAGAQQVNPDIRRVVDRESAALAEKDNGFVKKLLDYGTGRTPGAVNDVTVEASGESRRLRENRALGYPVTQGETPETEPPERTGFLQRAFDNLMGR